MTRRRGLDTASVVAAAVDLLRRDGPDGLTLHRLAAELGVQTPSLYNHVAGMSGLQRELSLLNARLLADSLGVAAMGRSGADGLRAVAQAYRAYIKENAGLYQASLRAAGVHADGEWQAAEERVVRIVLAVLDSFRLSGKDAVHAVRALRSAVHGFALLEIGGGFGLPLDLDESFLRLINTLIAGLQAG